MKNKCVICGNEFECLAEGHIVCSSECGIKYAAQWTVHNVPKEDLEFPSKTPTYIPYPKEIKKELWEILVPRFWNNGKKIYITHHWKWDEHIRKISGGLTILKPATGIWVSPDSNIVKEQMIPVRIYCSEIDMNKIIEFTLRHYNQKEVMAYVISQKVKLIRNK